MQTPEPSAACVTARVAVVALRKRGQARKVTLVFPSRWRRAALLAYVRSQHPGETVRIVEWQDAFDGWDALLWMPNPAAFADYRRGVMYEEARNVAA